MTPDKNRPNILFILIDDLGWVDLGIQGSAFYETPHLDVLSRQGMSFPMPTPSVRSVRRRAPAC